MYVRPQRQRMNFNVSKRLSRRKSLRSSITAGLRMSTRKPVMSATLSGGIVTSMEVTHWRGSDPGSAWQRKHRKTLIFTATRSINCLVRGSFHWYMLSSIAKYQKFEGETFYSFILESFISKRVSLNFRNIFNVYVNFSNTYCGLLFNKSP